MIINKKTYCVTIRSWQEFLTKEGYNTGGVEGTWGPHTEAASKAFQKAEKLRPDGIVGSNTIAAAEAMGFIIAYPQPFDPLGTFNGVFDISHNNHIAKSYHDAKPTPAELNLIHNELNVAFKKAYNDGMRAVFQKATQSNTFPDPTYLDRRAAAIDAGLLWGAFHFGAKGDGVDQATYFLDYALNTENPEDTLLVLDFEKNTTSGEETMTLGEAQAFVQHIYEKTGKYPGIYGSDLLRRNDPLSNFPNCWLWVAEYERRDQPSWPTRPNGVPTYKFWQYTDGRCGPGAIPVDGIGACDRDLFKGTASELADFWAAHAVREPQS